MIFISGINEREKEIEYDKMLICPECGELGSIKLVKIYQNLSVFFIPTLSWNKKYYVQMSCCDTVFSISEEIGKGIESGNSIEIDRKDLVKEKMSFLKTCKYCNYALEEGFKYCPNCGVIINEN